MGDAGWVQPSPDVYVEWVEDEAVVLNRASGEIHYLNTPAAYFLALALEDGVEHALATVRASDPAPPEEEIEVLLSDMKELGLLIDD